MLNDRYLQEQHSEEVIYAMPNMQCRVGDV